MTDDEHLENTVQASEDDAAFDVLLPITTGTEGAGATHVAHMRGDERAYLDVLAGFVATGSDLSAPLREPVSDLDQVHLALDGLGSARVESIEPVSQAG